MDLPLLLSNSATKFDAYLCDTNRVKHNWLAQRQIRMQCSTSVLSTQNVLEVDFGVLKIHIQSPEHENPLQWKSWNHAQLVAEGGFLEEPGFMLDELLACFCSSRVTPAMKAIADAVPRKQYQLMQAMLSSEAAAELAQSNWLLFVLLVDYAEYHRIDRPTFQRMVKRRRVAILREMGLVDSAAAVRVLARTGPGLMTNSQLQSVFQVCEDETMVSMLHHVIKPTPMIYPLLFKYRHWVWPHFLQMASSCATQAEVNAWVSIVQDSLRMGASLRQLHGISSQNQLTRLHDRLVERYNARTDAVEIARLSQEYGAYPPPPITGNEMIQPLVSWEELVNEGREMRHCVASWHYRVKLREVFIYRVYGADRLTLAIARQGDGWRILEVKSYCNRPAPTYDLHKIQQWLSGND